MISPLLVSSMCGQVAEERARAMQASVEDADTEVMKLERAIRPAVRQLPPLREKVGDLAKRLRE
eukprot:38762-Eustigmatos_ZCMA.PRE.1